MSDNAKLTYKGEETELPLIQGAEGDAAIDIRSLRKNTELITFAPG